MTEAFIRRWYSNIPELERDLPIIYYKGKVYTPHEVYEEVIVKKSNIGDEIQKMLERMASPHTVSYEDLINIRKAAEERAKKIIEYLPKGFSIVSASGEVLEGDEILKKLGKSAVNYEMKRILKLIKGGTHGYVSFP